MQVAPLSFPAFGFDCITKMDAARAAGLYGAGMRFACRYLGSLDTSERDIILASGLKLLPVTYSRAPGWQPSASVGASDGTIDVAHLGSAGIPQGCHVMIDLEGVNPQAAATDVSAWINARARGIKLAGYRVGVYVGFEGILTGAELYALPDVTCYWKSLSKVPEPTCGWQLIQLYKTITLAGTQIDVNATQYDYNDRLPYAVSA